MPAGQGNMPGVLLNGEIYVVGADSAGAQFAYNRLRTPGAPIAALPTSGGMCPGRRRFVQDNERG